ncbi:hypothetical protein DFH29DRAFT_885393 [Suillus ampliporus]|nr:hypothetical protein DFH29DRAFT_885393 [Suillus ampliporus]
MIFPVGCIWMLCLYKGTEGTWRISYCLSEHSFPVLPDTICDRGPQRAIWLCDPGISKTIMKPFTHAVLLDGQIYCSDSFKAEAFYYSCTDIESVFSEVWEWLGDWLMHE